MQILQYSPGQKVTIFLETIDSDGVRHNSATTPSIFRIIFPDLSLASDFPQNMTKLDVGLYYYQFTLPSGATAVGTYFVDMVYTNPINGVIINSGYQIIVNAPYGNFNAITGG
jgi:hypothetical protein